MFKPLLSFVCGVILLACGPARGAADEPPTKGVAQAIRVSHGTGPLRIGIIGLQHGHVEGLLWAASQRSDLKIVGISEPSRVLFDRLAAKYKLDPTLYHALPAEMLDASKPEAVSVMSSIKHHLMAAEACAPRGVHMLFEKPLAFSKADAGRIQELSYESPPNLVRVRRMIGMAR